MICPDSHKHAGSTSCYKKHGCRCVQCAGLAADQKRAARDAGVPRLSPRTPCERCGVDRVVHSSRVQPWCRDCRLVEGAEMQEAWAA